MFFWWNFWETFGPRTSSRDPNARGIVAGRGYAYRHYATIAGCCRVPPDYRLSVGRGAHRHRGRVPVVHEFEQQFRPPAGHHQVRVHELGRGDGDRGRAAVPHPVHRDPLAVQLELIVYRRVAGPPEVQRYRSVRAHAARRPPLDGHPQARRVPPFRQSVQPLRAAAHQQDRVGRRVTAANRAIGHVTQVRPSRAVNVTPRARRIARRVPAVIGRPFGGPVGEVAAHTYGRAL